MKARAFFIVSIALILPLVPLRASGEITEQEAMELAHKEIVKYHIDPKYWKTKLDKTLAEWNLKRRSWEEWMKNTNETWPRRRIGEVETAIWGKNVWLVVYDLPVPPGKRILHTHAIVFLDADSGRILSVIHHEE